MKGTKTVVVCDRCLCASCLQGHFCCDYAKIAGTREISVIYLKLLNLENEKYWKDNPDDDE